MSLLAEARKFLHVPESAQPQIPQVREVTKMEPGKFMDSSAMPRLPVKYKYEGTNYAQDLNVPMYQAKIERKLGLTHLARLSHGGFGVIYKVRFSRSLL